MKRNGRRSEILSWSCTSGYLPKEFQPQRLCSLGHLLEVRAQLVVLVNEDLPDRCLRTILSSPGGLILLAMLYIRDHTSLPQPRCAVAHSPWTDVSSALTGIKGHPLLETDYIHTYDQTYVAMNDMLRPDGLPFNTPEISPVLAKDVSRLPPQLVFYGDAEILMTDSTRWIKRSRDAGVRVDVHVGKGEMHTYSNGWPVGAQRTEMECDDLMLNYIFTELAPPL